MSRVSKRQEGAAAPWYEHPDAQRRQYVFRPEAPDSDWGKLHVVPQDQEAAADALLDRLVDRLAQMTPEEIGRCAFEQGGEVEVVSTEAE